MKPTDIAGIFCLFVTFIAHDIRADEERLRMTAMDWPPYTTSQMDGQGISAQIVRDVFETLGYRLEVEFLPWQRSLVEPIRTDKYLGTFPVYLTDERKAFCLFSVPIGRSPLGFVQHKTHPAKWESFEDLTSYRIGTVMGYSNTDAFDALAHDGTLDVSFVPTDFHNLRRLAFDRIDLAVMDKYVMQYLLSTRRILAPYRNRLEFNTRSIEVRNHHICFTKTEAGARLRAAFDQAFSEERASRLTEAAMERLGYE